MDVVRYGRKTMIETMILFFIAGVIGRIVENDLAIKAGFLLAMISAIFIIIFTFKISKDEKK